MMKWDKADVRRKRRLRRTCVPGGDDGFAEVPTQTKGKQGFAFDIY